MNTKTWRVLVRVTDNPEDDKPATKEMVTEAIERCDLPAGLTIFILDAFVVNEEVE